jgi:hypothetical protein
MNRHTEGGYLAKFGRSAQNNFQKIDRRAIATRSPWKGESGLEIGPDDLHALLTFSLHLLGLDRVEKQDLGR